MNPSQEEINQRETEKEFTNEVIRIGIFNCAFQFYMIIFSCKLIWLFDTKYVIIFAWFMDLASFIIIMLDKNITKVLSVVNFVEKVLSISFKITIVIHFEVKEMRLYYIPAAHLLIATGLFLFSVLNHDASKRKHIIIAHSYSVLYAIQLLLLSLKWNNLFEYSYYQTFIIAWTALGINTFLIVLLLITMVENCFLKNIPQINGTIIFWFIFYILGLTIPPFFQLKTICEFYEEDSSQIFVLIYLFLFIFFTLRIKKQLIGVLQLDHRQNTIPKTSPKGSSSKKWRKLKIPIMFIRISASYYKMITRQSTVDTSTRNTSSIPICSDVLRPDSINFRQSPYQAIVKQMKKKPKNQDSGDCCLICFENEPDVVLHPCNHGGICNNCSENLIKTTKQCFLCRSDIKYALKINQKDGEMLEATDVQKV
ncbi:unnamed protein product (macronuclear) [Paramecium tetraurelia]|uniref:RING-type domain-containing protein n=1 Tax=Paramecium tetraurelia TaxID=5888 RepID=A0EDX3_PARTE|nr:uncharacterized protein GSPATT00025834001 [Paramecium tetraurelia]CAK93490.1 unnamed protein product [Paramecium tetraurelia]|eukprot:XP_001460887.1 hypothetical protein (macronuclear) [Paramecium tetraurelia strain d4-2]